jgi:hypothetical protein
VPGAERRDVMGDVVAFVNLRVLNALESRSGAGQVGRVIQAIAEWRLARLPAEPNGLGEARKRGTSGSLTN